MTDWKDSLKSEVFYLKILRRILKRFVINFRTEDTGCLFRSTSFLEKVDWKDSLKSEVFYLEILRRILKMFVINFRTEDTECLYRCSKKISSSCQCTDVLVVQMVDWKDSLRFEVVYLIQNFSLYLYLVVFVFKEIR